jgi:hypothetical protein
MLIIPGDQLVRRFTEIFHHISEAGFYNQRVYSTMHWYKFFSHKIAIVQKLDGYYSFNLYHIKPPFFSSFNALVSKCLLLYVLGVINRLLSKIS